jgi:curved DNA-binding protein CbpA
MKTYYTILGIKENASPKEIKSAYKTLMKKYHPDVYKGDLKQAEKISSEINVAYDVLGNPTSRAEYDQMLLEQREEKTQAGYSYYNYQHSTTNTNTAQKNYRNQSPQDIYDRITKNRNYKKDNYSNSYSYRAIYKTQNYVQNKLMSLNYFHLIIIVLVIFSLGFLISAFELLDFHKNINKRQNPYQNTTNSVTTKKVPNTYYYPPYDKKEDSTTTQTTPSSEESFEDYMIEYGFDKFFDNSTDFALYIYNNLDLLEKYLNQELTQDEYFDELYDRAEKEFN